MKTLCSGSFHLSHFRAGVSLPLLSPNSRTGYTAISATTSCLWNFLFIRYFLCVIRCFLGVKCLLKINTSENKNVWKHDQWKSTSTEPGRIALASSYSGNCHWCCKPTYSWLCWNDLIKNKSSGSNRRQIHCIRVMLQIREVIFYFWVSIYCISQFIASITSKKQCEKSWPL